MSKYDPLKVFLQQAAPRDLRLSFEEIERILGFTLPASKQYPAWWSNSATNNTMTKAWLDAGYRTEQVDVAEGKLTFHAETQTNATKEASMPRSPLFGSMKGTTFVMPGVDLTAPTLDPEWLKKYDAYDPTDVIAQHEVSKIASNDKLNVSEKIRALGDLGVPRSEIAKLLGKRYQHVRNVLIAEEQRARLA